MNYLSKRPKIIQVGFEMTRRCNMNCKFCSRGDAQNLDISKEVIDKALDELKMFDIHILRLHGGEPLLVPNMIEYLIDGIIERGININQCAFFSNGTILDPIIKKSLYKIGEYCEKHFDNELAYYYDSNNPLRNIKLMYKNIDAPCSIIVSEYEHEKIDFEKFKKYYNDKYVQVYRQKIQFLKETENIDISVEGKAKDNLEYLIKKGYKKFSIFEDRNHFCIIDDQWENLYGEISIDKSISIAANGNVFVGCNQAYIEADKKNICNILECSNNLYNKINKWCWEYPLHGTQQLKKFNFKNTIFCHNIGTKYRELLKENIVDDNVMMLANKIISCFDDLEMCMKEYHNLFPILNHFEIQMLATYEYAKNIPYEYRNIIMNTLSAYKDKESYSDEKCDLIIDKIRELYYKKTYGIAI